jgi:hypothetical protein
MAAPVRAADLGSVVAATAGGSGGAVVIVAVDATGIVDVHVNMMDIPFRNPER